MNKDIKLVAFYKVFSGEEWLLPSVLSIYNHVEKIVILTSDYNWSGSKGNPSIPMIENIVFDNDPDGKIIHIHHNEVDQLKHCEFGYNYIRKNLIYDFVMLIDSDEIWDDENLIRAKHHLSAEPLNSGILTYRTQTYTYVKSPFYRVHPIEQLHPVCFVRSTLSNLGTEARACSFKETQLIDDVYYHHFVHVRLSSNKVLEKIITSHISEKQPYREIMDEWVPNCWNKLPNVVDFHVAIGFESTWKSIVVISKSELPQILQNHNFEIMEKFND